jgi:HEAT repeat protein
LARAFSSDLALAFAFGTALAALASAVALLVIIAMLRVARRWRAWRLARGVDRWREALHLATEDPARAALPAIAAVDLPDFLMLWNHFQESIKGAAADNLATLLRRERIDERALAMLRRRSLRLKLIAITALGHLREERAWHELARLSQGPGPVISFAAARALLRIEPRRALDLLAPSIVRRSDWSLARLGSIFHELGPDLVTPPLVTMLVARPRHGLDRVVRLARFGHRGRISTIVRGWLSASDDPEVIVAALDYVESLEDLPWARGAARHPAWAVRMAAARAIGRVGERRELAILLELLRDPVWWVRYHAAQALTRLHGLEAGELENIREHARDAYASDMLAQALAERGWPA